MTFLRWFFVLFLAVVSPAHAALTRVELGSVKVVPPPRATLPSDLKLHDLNGKAVALGAVMKRTPSVLLFVDFTCKTICGPIIAMTSEALAQTGLTPQRDYHLIILGLDPKDSAEQAKSFVYPQLDPKVRSATLILRGNGEAIRRATQAVGYHYLYDSQYDQFAHPTAALILTREGRLSAVLSALGISGTDMRLALVSAGEGLIGTLADRLRLICYCYDPATGIYSASISWALDVAALLTLLGVGSGLLWLHRSEGRSA